MKSISSFSAAVPGNLEAVLIGPTFIELSWSPPFSGNYLITYNSNGEVSGGSNMTPSTTFNITVLPSFTLFTVEVRPNDSTVVDCITPARIVVGTLADPMIPGYGGPVTFSEGSPKGDGTQSQVTITIPKLVFSNNSSALR